MINDAEKLADEDAKLKGKVKAKNKLELESHTHNHTHTNSLESVTKDIKKMINEDTDKIKESSTRRSPGSRKPRTP